MGITGRGSKSGAVLVHFRRVQTWHPNASSPARIHNITRHARGLPQRLEPIVTQVNKRRITTRPLTKLDEIEHQQKESVR